MSTCSMWIHKTIAGWKAILLLPVLLAVCLLPAGILAQRTTATLIGNVTDATGALVVHATVTITNVETNISSTGTTSEAGEYRFELVPVGTYSVTVTAKGFRKYLRPAVPLTVNQTQTLNVQLTPGTTEESVTVTAEPPQLDLETATVERTLESREVDNLPILDRNIYNLLNLIPGVQSNQVGGNTLGFNQQVLQMNGGTTADNTGTVSYYLDGGLNMTALRMTGNDMPSPEAIAEFNVQASNYDATYGRMSSGVVTALTKSGTNKFHGSAYEFNRNTDFDAGNPANVNGTSSPGTPIVHRNMFGATIGGPIRRDKTFFFAEWGEIKQISPKIFSGATLPTTVGNAGGTGTTGGEVAGDFSALLTAANKTLVINPATPFKQCSSTVICNPATGIPYTKNGTNPSDIITSTLDPTAANVLNYVVGFENSTVNATVGGVATTLPSYNGQEAQPYDTWEYLIKGEHQLTARQRLTASYFHSTGSRQIPSGSPSLPWVAQNQNWTQNLANVSDTIAFSNNLINQTYFNYSRLMGGRANTWNAGVNGRESLAAFGSNISVQGPPSLPQLAVSGYFTLGNAIDGPEAGTDFYAVRNLLILNKGKHSLTVGGEASLNKDQQVTDLNNYGVFTFSSSTTARSGNALADFVLGLPGTQTQDQPVDAIDNSFFYALFAQDNWRIRQNLTINLGVRWDLQTAPTDPQNKESTFVPGVQSTVNPLMPAGELVVGDKGVTRGTIANSYKHFSPRVGLAWDPFGNGKTSVRASAGIFWGGVSGNEWNASSNYYPFSLRYTFPKQGSLTNPYCAGGITTGCTSDSPFPFTYTPGAVNPIPAGGTIEGVVPNFVWPSTYQLTASVQQQVTKNAAISVAYVGSLARHLPMSVDENYPVFNTTTPTANTTSNANTRRPYYSTTPTTTIGGVVTPTQELGVTYGVTSGQTSNYNAMQITFSQRVAKGISFNGFYTWSKNLDSGVLNSSTPSSTSTVEDHDNLKIEKGPDDYDMRAVFGMSIVWVPDYFHGANRAVKGILDGWHISSVINLHTGTPFNITTGSDNNQDGNTTDRPTWIFGTDPFVTVNRGSRVGLAKEFFNPTFWTASTTTTEPTGTIFCGYSTSDPTGCPGVGPGGSDGALRRDGFYGPGYRDIDMSLFRDFAIWQQVKLQARAEASNVFNLVSLGGPNANLSSATAGTITSASGMREIQLGLRLTF
ncbi:MAG: carboxypeptidase regulatory-like domain-containing protein [Terracidiphilus sp.]